MDLSQVRVLDHVVRELVQVWKVPRRTDAHAWPTYTESSCLYSRLGPAVDETTAAPLRSLRAMPAGLVGAANVACRCILLLLDLPVVVFVVAQLVQVEAPLERLLLLL